MKVSEIWESEEQYRTFSEVVLPVLNEAGVLVGGEPEVFEVHPAGAAHRRRREDGGRAPGRLQPWEEAIRVSGVDSTRFELRAIGRVESSLADPESAPNQGDEGAPDAWLRFEPSMLDALEGIRTGDELIILTWLHRARRDILRVHPRGDTSREQQGVFTTRSPDRPNPIGLHRVDVASIDGARMRVHNLEAVHGTPIVDVKPVLSADISER